LPDLIVRPACPEDAQAVCSLYAWHVAHGTATFDLHAPDVAAWERKIGEVCARGWTFLVAERDGDVLGYAYATQFRDRAAYAKTCENSIYVADAARGRGVGSALLAALVKGACACGFEQMIAVIGGGEPASVALHAKGGFVEAGRLRKVGHKLGRVLDTVYMQRDLTAEEPAA
jgi:L-amino acid N-acyltransferase YncA